jgi:uncharacterized protein
MLKLDLVRLDRQRRARLDDELPADDPIWAGTGVDLARPLDVRLEAQQVGHDVVVRGRLEGAVRMECRRCLRAVEVPIDEEVAVLYQAGVDRVEAEESEVYPLPERGSELDLAPMVREQVLLAVPAFAICRESCRGLCPTCGKDLNEGPCDCRPAQVDDRWAALRRLKSD